MIHIGIDPGAHGGLVAIYPDLIAFATIPSSEEGIWRWFQARIDSDHLAVAVIEQVSGYIGDKQPGSAAFKFGQSYGTLRMALVAAGIPFKAVRPQEWQRGLGIEPKRKSESKVEWKNRLKCEAERLYPRYKMTLATADAFLLAHFCKKINDADSIA